MLWHTFSISTEENEENTYLSLFENKYKINLILAQCISLEPSQEPCPKFCDVTLVVSIGFSTEQTRR